jgi:hypothetical protein
MHTERRKDKRSDEPTIGRNAGGKESARDAKPEKHELARALKHSEKARKKADDSPGDVAIDGDD